MPSFEERLRGERALTINVLHKPDCPKTMAVCMCVVQVLCCDAAPHSPEQPCRNASDEFFAPNPHVQHVTSPDVIAQEYAGSTCANCGCPIGKSAACQCFCHKPQTLLYEHSVLTPQQRACLNGEHEAAPICKCGFVEFSNESGSHLHAQVGREPFCRHCRVRFVPREA